MKLKITSTGLQSAQALANAFSGRRINAAVATALTRTAREIDNDWRQQLGERFDRPTRATERGTVVIRAEAASLAAEIKLRDAGPDPDSTPAGWLAHQELGGSRRVKKFERALQKSGAMPAGWQVVPGKGALRDSFGNISRGQIVQVLNQLGQDLSPGYARVIGKTQAKRIAAARRTGRTYVAFPKEVGKFVPGVYLRQGRELTPVFIFKQVTRYAARLDLRSRAAEIAAREFSKQLQRALSEQLLNLRGVR